MIAERLIAHVQKRPPDFVIGGKEPYMNRWWIIPRNRWFNVYVHQFLRSDDDRALHDHMYASMSIILRGTYLEHLKDCRRFLMAGDWVIRWSGKTAHRIELLGNPCWTLFITGPRYREWGFVCGDRWVHWQDFVDARDAGAKGKGCDQ